MNYNRTLRWGMLLLLLSTELLHGQVLLFAAKEKGKKYGFINERGEYLIAPTFDYVGSFSRGAAVVQKSKKYGIINEQGQFTVQPQYDGAHIYAPEGKFTVKKGDKWGVISATGEIIIPFQYEYLSVLKDGYVVAGKFIPGKQYKGKVCPLVLNERNEPIYGPGSVDPEEHDCTQLFLPGLADKVAGTYSNGWPMVRDGWLVVKEAWEGVKYAQLKLVHVRSGYSLTLPGEMVMSDNYFGFREGSIAVDKPQIPEEWSEDNDYVSTENGTMVPKNAIWQGFMYDSAHIRVGNFDLSFLNQPQGPEGTEPYTRAHPFFNGVASMESNGRWVFVDRDGWIINETNLSTSEYKAYPPMYFNGLIGMYKNGKAGFVDITGKEVIPFTLDEYHPFEYSVTPVKKNGLYGLLRKDGSWAVQPKFADLFITPCPCYQ